MSPETNVDKIIRCFDADALRRICEMHESDFAKEFGLDRIKVKQQKSPSNFYLHRDNNSDILAVAHLDTVGPHQSRTCHFVNTEAGPVVFSRALDDRLGAYIILDLLPKLGIKFDWLLTVGEESGLSTAQFFEPDKEYNWMIEFDRGGTDVVTYQYQDEETDDLISASGAKLGDGSFSDISYLEHLEIKGFNWGVGYRDYHGPRAHAFLYDTFQMVSNFMRFHEKNADTYLPHQPVEDDWSKMPAWVTDADRDWAS